MKILILGATGGVGRHLVEQAVANGHDVSVVCRDVRRIPTGWPVTPHRLDLSIATSAELAVAVAGTDAVVSALGHRSKSDRGVLGRSAETVVGAMWEAGVRRFIGISAAPLAPAEDFTARYLMMPIVKRAFAEVYRDTADMEAVLREAQVDWTVVRPPRLTNHRLTGTYRTAFDRNLRHGRSIGRADLAQFMLAAISEGATIGHAIGIAY
ncbi:NAD(P)-dependent oxidoreductase [Smaragdicoccus niigatensis]|uniref:NAD(P)-dependent oxidoreductase n=1 Tax=Smaragdicoccus niigatensis TaxID=359359 RepID=UPI000373F206|nr:NAD(P)H-binding protein [Smaragdicoccus niigatensis]